MTSTVIDSPVGPLFLRADDGALTHIVFSPDAAPDPHPRDDPVLRATIEQLEAYFAGSRTAFDLPLAPAGSDFQLRVWKALLDIPYGRTESYGELARRIGLPTGAARAVGAANGQNPLPIVVPCHRVIGSGGSLTGYGGGLDNKRLLLELEARVCIERELGATPEESRTAT